MKRLMPLARASAIALIVMAAPAAASQPTPVPAAAAEDSAYRTSHTPWRASEGGFSSWALEGAIRTAEATLQLDPGTAGAETDPYPPGGYLGGDFYNGGSFTVGHALSPVQPAPFNFAEAIVSWNAQTPPGTWIEIQMRARTGDRFTKFYNLGVWAADSSTVARHSVRAQGDADGFVAVDTLVLDKKLTADAFQVKLRLFSATPGAVPTVRNAFVALSSPLGHVRSTTPGDPSRWNRLLAVPECSQMVYPDGGTVWCSPTSTSMVMSYWAGDTGPCEPRVRAAVAGVYDRVYDGDGNWPFNTAYAATAGLEAHVARFTSMADAERWIAAGVPVVISYYWKRNSLTGAPIPTSDGHLAVIVGFDAAGNPIVNDPAAASDGEVQQTYLRSELEDLWVAKSGGTAYLIYPPGHPVPAV
ncbi:MAG: C39 family peptidase [Acidimicrobiales bacterium]